MASVSNEDFAKTPEPKVAPKVEDQAPLTEKVTKVPTAIKGKFRKLSKMKQRLVIGGLIVFAFVAVKVLYGLLAFESTDDAFLKGHVHIISARVPGTVTAVKVEDNQTVKSGVALVQLDQNDYDVAVKIAQANYSKAHKDVGRFSAYLKDLGPTDKPVFDQYQASALVSEAELTKAQLNYEYTTVKAPSAGKIGKRNVEVGDQVQTGQALMALVEDNPWVEANFKEHQVAHIRVGQKVEIEVDAISGHKFEGRVESIAPGSGSLFSLLPPDNATGNFTKIVQRIPVKIVFDKESMKGFEDRLIPGMSSEISIKVW